MWPPGAAASRPPSRGGPGSVAPSRESASPSGLATSRANEATILAVAERARADAAQSGRPEAGEATWTAAGWLSSLRVSDIVARALLRPVGAAASGTLPTLELAFLRGLGSIGSLQAVRERMGATLPPRDRHVRSPRERHVRPPRDRRVTAAWPSQVRELLADGMLDELAHELWDGARGLARAEAVTCQELQEKLLT